MLVFRDLWYNKICASVLLPLKLRPLLLKAGGVKIGKHVSFHPRCFIGNKNLTIGEGTFINYNVWFNTAGGINIGKKCNIACKVTFVTSTHEIGDTDRRAGKNKCDGIEIEDGCWIGAGAMILPGVHIGHGTVIAAGSVVTKDCEPDCLYAGNPAILKKRL